ncbi:MAG: HEPN domain-containing protein [Gammaproteobacteria bacterium]|nr:HEPN domain-containing protein [Gammaproteobacteria bacterium]MBU1655926.1 HEPN domain-containing protein [Gammaproteobacteria bacterium]MBU1961798.1 HEPN domain-containing protein [Gammaproteobacteria bacterium]
MTVDDYMGKADPALSAARLLLDNGDIEGACNRAYYAMFDGAHAALLASGLTIAESMPKKHSGLIAAFGLRLVKTHRLAADLGSAINKVERLRRLADYTGDPIAQEDAAWAVEQAAALLAAVRQEFMSDGAGEGDK